MLVSFVQAQDVELQVELMNGIGTGSSHKGDLVSARVLGPAALQGDVLEGKIANVEQGGGKAVLKFSFETLRHAGQAVPISSEIRSIANSKGEVDVDENGNAIRKSRRRIEAVRRRPGRRGHRRAAWWQEGRGRRRRVARRRGRHFDRSGLGCPEPHSRRRQQDHAPGQGQGRSGPGRPGAERGPGGPSRCRAAPAQAAPAAATPAPQAGGQPDLVAVKADFVPGDKVIMYDDFSDMAGDEPPPHWKVRGGTAELRAGEGVRQLTMTAQGRP
ncbi:MAG: hypothetical protein MZU84_08915 [Sphingobacterium sp.]|nr:hypothetical protein [Sphingobacterium sp.]